MQNSNMYKLYNNVDGSLGAIIRLSDQHFIPVNKENTDYQFFKSAVDKESANLQDADGNLLSAEEAKAFVSALA